jgi:hydrogenase maturation protein HypF
MLPYTPVHFLLMRDGIDTIVMTSANISDLPVIYKNEEALSKLKGVADGFLINNREIHVRCDDSLLRVFEGKEYLLRRSRGYVPFPVKVSGLSNSILACGAEQKASFAVTKDNYVFMSQHIGDLKNIETLSHYEYQIEHFKRLFNIDVKVAACDLHPDYMSTDYAESQSQKNKIPLIKIQHHHAHMASCMADNNISDDVIGIIWDGTGYGTDGTIWGGEFLTGGFRSFERAGTIRPLMLPGGDASVKDIYRLSYALLYDTFGEIPEMFLKSEKDDLIISLMEKNINCPAATSIGRLFDGVAALLNFKDRVSYEGQGAIILENSAEESDGKYIYEIYKNKGMFVFDWRPMIKKIVTDIKSNEDKALIAAKFMNTLVDAAAEISNSIRGISGINNLVLSGGVLQNMYLLEKMVIRLRNDNFNVYYHNRVSTNDEGIALGQVMIAENGGGI